MNNIQFIDIGFSNLIEASKILTINKPGSAPIKRVVQQAKDKNLFLDLTEGKRTRSIITQMSLAGIVIVASSVQPATIKDRVRRSQQEMLASEIKQDDIIATSMVHSE